MSQIGSSTVTSARPLPLQNIGTQTLSLPVLEQTQSVSNSCFDMSRAASNYGIFEIVARAGRFVQDGGSSKEAARNFDISLDSGPISQINSLGGLLKNETDSLMSNEEFKNIIAQLETDIANGTWLHKNYSKMDLKIMPELVMQANNKYPEMNLNFVKSPWGLPIEIKNTMDSGVESSRFIVNLGEDGIHFCVIDYKHFNEKTSLILFEPASFHSSGPVLLACRIKIAIENYPLPDCHFSMVEMDIQRSSSECGIFSLALAKKLYIERDSLFKVHEDNIKGTLSDSEKLLPLDKPDSHLPVTFYKHTQGLGRLNEYLKANPQGVSTVINKQNETILNRFDNNKSVIAGMELSVSAHKKRINEYKTLLKSWRV